MLKSLARWLAAACAALTLAVAPATAQVPDPYARQLAQALARADVVLGGDGYRLAAGPFSGALNQRGVQHFQLTLRAGQDYRVIGVCDARCTDLDLRLYDPGDAVIADDSLPDDDPSLQVRPRTTGSHTLEVTVWTCSAQPCYFAFNVYTRTQ